LWTRCWRHKCLTVCPRAQHLLRTQKMFLILSSLRSPRNIMSNSVSATLCPRLPGPLIFLICNHACLFNHQCYSLVYVIRVVFTSVSRVIRIFFGSCITRLHVWFRGRQVPRTCCEDMQRGQNPCGLPTYAQKACSRDSAPASEHESTNTKP